jgi:hypothetical protein
MLLDYDRIFQLPLSMPVSHQLVELMDSLAEWHREPNENDRWVYIWGSSIFTSKQAYENMKGDQQVPPCFSGYGSLIVKANIKCISGSKCAVCHVQSWSGGNYEASVL